MSEFGDLLERLHGAHRSWRTVQMAVHRWTDEAVTHQAWETHAARSRPGSVVTRRARDHEPPRPGLAPHPVERVWIDRPGRRFRVEVADGLRVHVGDLWWHYDAEHGAMSNEAEPEVKSGGHGLETLLDPAPQAGLVDLTVGGPTTVDGRPGRTATVVRRDFGDNPHGWGWAFYAPGATDFDWVVDDERGVLLRVDARFDGVPYQVTELHDLIFDGELADELFVFAPPDGAEVQPLPASLRPEHVTIEEAARRAPFTVLVPARAPEGSRVRVELIDGKGRLAPAVWVHITSADHLHNLRLHQSAEPIDDALDWEDVTHDGVTYQVCDAGSEVIVKRDLHGAHARLSGNYDRATMVEIAASLRPAPTAPPPLVSQ